MKSMFMLASAFNQPVNHFVTGNVKTFFSMFDSAGRFNQAVGGWDVSSANDMSFLFHKAVSFDQPLRNWDVQKVYTMGYMFGSADDSMVTRFDQPLDQWDTSSVASMFGMFKYNSAFDQELAGRDVRAVTNFEDMFANSRFSQMSKQFHSSTWGRICRMHLSWSAQNAGWSTIVAGLPNFEVDRCVNSASPPPPPPPPPTPAKGYDPSLLCPPNRAEVHPLASDPAAMAEIGITDDGVCYNTSMSQLASYVFRL